jgi:hypothetical protein
MVSAFPIKGRNVYTFLYSLWVLYNLTIQPYNKTYNNKERSKKGAVAKGRLCVSIGYRPLTNYIDTNKSNSRLGLGLGLGLKMEAVRCAKFV